MTEVVRARAVLHVDLDMFFVAAELRRRPDLRGRPVIVAGHGPRAVVSSASYEARSRGVRSGMALGEALRRCPEATVLRTDPAYYRELSERFRRILEQASDRVEVLSVDEACLELGKHVAWPETVRAAAVALRWEIATRLELTATIGSATNRTVAKIAAELAKPDGLLLVPPGTEAAFLAPLPIETLPGIGPRTASELRKFGIETLGTLASAPVELLARILGRTAERVRFLAAGVDPRPVGVGTKLPRSLGHEETFPEDLTAVTALDAAVRRLAERTAADLRRQGLHGRTVVVKVRFADFRTVTRQRALPEPTSDGAVIGVVARELVRAVVTRQREPVRLLGVRVTGLSERAVQLPLLGTETRDPLRREQLLAILDALRAPASGGAGVGVRAGQLIDEAERPGHQGVEELAEQLPRRLIDQPAVAKELGCVTHEDVRLGQDIRLGGEQDLAQRQLPTDRSELAGRRADDADRLAPQRTGRWWAGRPVDRILQWGWNAPVVFGGSDQQRVGCRDRLLEVEDGLRWTCLLEVLVVQRKVVQLVELDGDAWRSQLLRREEKSAIVGVPTEAAWNAQDAQRSMRHGSSFPPGTVLFCCALNSVPRHAARDR